MPRRPTGRSLDPFEGGKKKWQGRWSGRSTRFNRRIHEQAPPGSRSPPRQASRHASKGILGLGRFPAPYYVAQRRFEVVRTSSSPVRVPAKTLRRIALADAKVMGTPFTSGGVGLGDDGHPQLARVFCKLLEDKRAVIHAGSTLPPAKDARWQSGYCFVTGLPEQDQEPDHDDIEQGEEHRSAADVLGTLGQAMVFQGDPVHRGLHRGVQQFND